MKKYTIGDLFQVLATGRCFIIIEDKREGFTDRHLSVYTTEDTKTKVLRAIHETELDRWIKTGNIKHYSVKSNS
jgi:hypothetical protein